MVSLKITVGITLALAATVSSAPTDLHGHRKSHHHNHCLVPGKHFDHFMVIVLENEDYEPNYIAMIDGQLFGIVDDNDYSVNEKSIVDILEPKGVSWKEYAEDYVPGTNGPATLQASSQNIVPATQLNQDIQSGNLPQFMYFTPNMNDDSHDTSLQIASKWLEGFIEPLMSNPKFNKNTAVLVTWDESKSYNNADQVWSVLIGSAVKPKKNNIDKTRYDHYSILATVEENWSLKNLGQNDTNATAFKW